MTFMPEKVTIYSVGLLGGSLGLALKNSGFKGKITGLSSPSAIETAKRLGCIDEGFTYDSLQDVIKDTDLLFLCSPISVILETLNKLSTMELPEGLLITDVGSTKQKIMEAAAFLPPHVYFCGGHPMTGSEKSGPSVSDPYLFQNAIYVLSPPSGSSGYMEKSFAAFLEKYLGCRTLFLEPSVHDRIVATVSHVPHLLAVALVCLAETMEEKIPGTLTLAAGGFRDMTRVASAPYPMWHDIFLTNKAAIDPLLESLSNILADIRENLKQGSLKEYFDRSDRIRSSISPANKGFLRKLSEVLVHAKDQPGVIASISALLAEKSINIKDIEVLKVREGEGGTIRLAFDNSDIARDAIALLSQNGFSARERT
ncbi:MAG: prephenate dehydrogenase/arogenate dehydrogenase family protein [Fibrobacter sp.]|jgi:prephenate dehydrogenase|nr:prephenate dehydrogenase/arogenate dehydrogenase family protein [Fibrobacter sp.]